MLGMEKERMISLQGMGEAKILKDRLSVAFGVLLIADTVVLSSPNVAKPLEQHPVKGRSLDLRRCW